MASTLTLSCSGQLLTALRNLTTSASLFACLGLAQTDISGFGGDGTGWSLIYAKYDGRPAVANDQLRLNDASYHLANSAFFSTAQDNRGFNATFRSISTTSYDGYNPGDGFAFVIQRTGPQPWAAMATVWAIVGLPIPSRSPSI